MTLQALHRAFWIAGLLSLAMCGRYALVSTEAWGAEPWTLAEKGVVLASTVAFACDAVTTAFPPEGVRERNGLARKDYGTWLAVNLGIRVVLFGASHFLGYRHALNGSAGAASTIACANNVRFY